MGGRTEANNHPHTIRRRGAGDRNPSQTSGGGGGILFIFSRVAKGGGGGRWEKWGGPTRQHGENPGLHPPRRPREARGGGWGSKATAKPRKPTTQRRTAQASSHKTRCYTHNKAEPRTECNHGQADRPDETGARTPTHGRPRMGWGGGVGGDNSITKENREARRAKRHVPTKRTAGGAIGKPHPPVCVQTSDKWGGGKKPNNNPRRKKNRPGAP
uniref:Uncharacterized protein n=1 Tax=Knipowitschia caucasica TaxID=637954 RepID=A0AAV2L1N9_KNICA